MLTAARLAVVEAADPPAGPAAEPLPPARAALAQRQRALRLRYQQVEQASRGLMRLQNIIASEQTSRNKLTALEERASVAVASWAIGGQADRPPVIPEAESIAAVRAELAGAETAANAARSALPQLAAQYQSAADAQRAAAADLDAARGAVLIDEARAADEQIRQAEAVLRERVEFLAGLLPVIGRPGPSIGGLAPGEFVYRMVARPELAGVAPDRARVDNATAHWRAFADRLLEDATATLSQETAP